MAFNSECFSISLFRARQYTFLLFCRGFSKYLMSRISSCSGPVKHFQNIFTPGINNIFNTFDSVEAKYHQIQKISKDVKCQSGELFTDGGRWVSSRPSFFIAPQCYLDICSHNALYFGDLGCTDYLCHIYICEENILWSS